VRLTARHDEFEPYRPERRGNRVAGAALFLAVTACWLLGLSAAEQDWIDLSFWVLPIAVVLSAVSVVATGYLGRRPIDAFWLGWIPGAAMMAIGFAMEPEPGGDETGATMVFFGGLVLGLGWPVYFFPLITVGAEVGRRRPRGAAAR
jgi:hypothetical protein